MAASGKRTAMFHVKHSILNYCSLAPLSVFLRKAVLSLLFPFAALTLPRSRVTARFFIYRYICRTYTPFGLRGPVYADLYTMPLTLPP